MTGFGRAFLPGPVEVHPDVLAALGRPMISPWSDEARALLHGLQPGLRRLFRTGSPVLLAASSATGFLEAAIRNVVTRRVLVLSGGFFGEWVAGVAEACGKEVVRLCVPTGRVVEPDHLARFLGGPPVDAVALVHSDTSTGALAPLADLARVVRERSDALVLVDAVTSIGAVQVETDAWGLDFVFTGSQKALALPPGLALGAASPRLLERAARVRDRGWYFDLRKYDSAARSGRPTQTPALSLLYALERQLGRIDAAGGVEARWDRHAAMLAALERWVDAHPGWAFLAEPGRRSTAVSALTPPAGRTVPDLLRRMRERGYTLTGGLGSLADRVVRIGHMGDLTPAHLGAMLVELGTAAV
ncbi:MAG TPA: alanine--glyoxylate aminotransferase family protein [Gemmatimonadales bacterium]|nr:alanine--glyoxylate aminotransferase family protein [Gemmatimonadales bacterium]